MHTWRLLATIATLQSIRHRIRYNRFYFPRKVLRHLFGKLDYLCRAITSSLSLARSPTVANSKKNHPAGQVIGLPGVWLVNPAYTGGVGWSYKLLPNGVPDHPAPTILVLTVTKR